MCFNPGFKLNQLCILPRSINFCYEMICGFLLCTFYPSISFANASVFSLFCLCRLRVLPENGLLFLSLVKSTHLVKAYKKTQEIVVSYSFQLALTICKSEEKIPCHEICALSPSTIRDTAVDCVSPLNFLTSRYGLW